MNSRGWSRAQGWPSIAWPKGARVGAVGGAHADAVPRFALRCGQRCCKSDFRLKDLKQRDLERVPVPAGAHMDTHDRWLRVIINLAIGALEPRRTRMKRRRKASAGAAAARGIPGAQAHGKAGERRRAAGRQRRQAMGDRAELGPARAPLQGGWETFIANAGVITAFANADMETLDYLGRKLGNVPMLLSRKSGASSSALLGGARPTQEELREIALAGDGGAGAAVRARQASRCW